MKAARLKKLVTPIEPTLSLFLGITTEAEESEIAGRVLAKLKNLPDWVNRSDVIEAIENTRDADAAGVAVFCREGQHTFYAALIDPPTEDRAYLSNFPMLVPLLEAMHRSVDHTVVQIETQIATDDAELTPVLSHFPVNDEPRQWTLEPSNGSFGDLAELISNEVPHTSELVLVDCDPSVRGAIVDRLATMFSIDQTIVRLEIGALDLAEDVVRQVADHSATETVRAIKSLRFAVAHGQAVEGAAATLEALKNDQVHRLFVSTGAATDVANETLRAGILADASIHIVPANLSDGPSQGVGATLAIDSTKLDGYDNDGDDEGSVLTPADVAGAAVASVAIARAIAL